MKRSLVALIGSGLCVAAWAQDAALTLTSEPDRINYSVGFQIGNDFKGEPDTLNPELVVQGIADAVSGAEPRLSREEMQTVLRELQRKMASKAHAKPGQDPMASAEADKAFLKENAQKPGVVTLPSGLQYQVVEPGTGRSPGPKDRVSVDYRGTLVDGTEFDSSYKRGEPATFPVTGVIRGWVEALQLMKEGGRWQLFIPADLAYGKQGPLAGRTLIFDVKLLEVQPATQPDQPETGAKPAAGQP
jgi:FKBP-type peptidyl-prolyl cis-trans isomerase FklB